jgi:hypothetical protein
MGISNLSITGENYAHWASAEKIPADYNLPTCR